jgi:hypothetical protein
VDRPRSYQGGPIAYKKPLCERFKVTPSRVEAGRALAALASIGASAKRPAMDISRIADRSRRLGRAADARAARGRAGHRQPRLQSPIFSNKLPPWTAEASPGESACFLALAYAPSPC